MTEYKYNKVLILFIVIGLLAALAIGWQRHVQEENNTRVEMVLDYEDLTTLARIDGVAVPELMRRFKEAGITSLSVYEMTLEKLNASGLVSTVPGTQILQQYGTGEKLNENGLVTAVPGMQIVQRYRTGGSGLADPLWRSFVEAGRIRAEDVYVIGHDPETFAEVKEDLIRRLGLERVRVLVDGNTPILVIKADYEKVIKWNLGLSSAEMREVAANGFYVVARPSNYTKVKPDDVNAVFRRLSGIGNVSSIMFTGEEVLGYPDLLTQTVEQMKQHNLTLAMIEHPLQLQFVKQEGLMDLAAAHGYQAARVYVIPKDEQPKLKPTEAIHRWLLTDQERNIRMNLLRTYEKPEVGKTLVETNLDYVAGVAGELKANGFTLGRATYFSPYFPSPYLLALVIVGATAAGVLLLTLIYPFAVRYQYGLLAVLSVLLIIPLFTGGGTFIRQAVATMSAILFPVLAMTWQLDRWRQNGQFAADERVGLGKMIGVASRALTVTVLLSLIGGFYVGAMLADVRFLLEIEIFRGVKLIFVAPLVVITLIYMTRYNIFGEQDEVGFWSIRQQVNRILNYPVYMKTLLGAAFVALAAWIYVGRSGHTAGVPVPALEIKLRYLLEQVMYARPRGKEFMVGHPAFFLLVMAAYRRWPSILHYALVVAATIGQGSLVETFAHMRTPVLMSFVRGLDGLVMGIVCGVIALAGVQLLHYLVFVWGRRTAEHE
ncbi:putative membrane protein [Propionispora sp. 2/2-37]|uniref:DUF5693 family protein n=1 Tax=Propionispora sp. 2/2-37 TaxID=1677858 RepID=UPI0006BB87EC|nr:DUF5693 family protein [Propionispora sp. 2/2-37]CUH94399.1 putative membrane protein [Propionispora sp. 2/2-37]